MKDVLDTNLQAQLYSIFIETLKKNGSITIQGIGRFTLAPSRKGKIYGCFGRDIDYKNKYQWRIKFKASETLRKKINE